MEENYSHETTTYIVYAKGKRLDITVKNKTTLKN